MRVGELEASLWSKAGGAGRVRAQQVREQLDRDLEEGHGIAMHADGSQDA